MLEQIHHCRGAWGGGAGKGGGVGVGGGDKGILECFCKSTIIAAGHGEGEGRVVVVGGGGGQELTEVIPVLL